MIMKNNVLIDPNALLGDQSQEYLDKLKNEPQAVVNTKLYFFWNH